MDRLCGFHPWVYRPCPYCEKKETKVGEMLVVFSNDRDGGVRVETVPKNVMLQRLNDGDYGEDPKFFTRADLLNKGQHGWDFANEGERGMAVFNLDGGGLVVPKEKTRVSTWDL